MPHYNITDRELFSLIIREGVDNIIDIDLCDRHNISDITILRECKNLKLVIIVGTKVTDISPLSECLELETLDLCGSYINSCEGLENLKKLKSCDISGTDIVDISPLSECSNIKKLNLSNTKIYDISPLVRCENLEKLDIHNTNVSNIVILAECSSLCNIDAGCTCVSLENIQELQNLKPYINIISNQLEYYRVIVNVSNNIAELIFNYEKNKNDIITFDPNYYKLRNMNWKDKKEKLLIKGSTRPVCCFDDEKIYLFEPTEVRESYLELGNQHMIYYYDIDKSQNKYNKYSFGILDNKTSLVYNVIDAFEQFYENYNIA
jgi:hypothetical protein